MHSQLGTSRTTVGMAKAYRAHGLRPGSRSRRRWRWSLVTGPPGMTMGGWTLGGGGDRRGIGSLRDMTAGAPRLVGRGVELGTLARAVTQARDGARTVVVVRGAAGLGKSRLVRESLAQLRAPPDAVGVGYGVELSAPKMPYRVVTDLLRTLCRDVGLGEVREAAGPYASALRPLHPGLADEGDLEVSPARLLPAFVATVEELAADRLVWLVVEDLPWVDAASRDLLAYLVRVVDAGRLLVVVTTRTHDPATEAASTEMVDALTLLDGVTPVVLGPLDHGELAELVHSIAPGASSKQLELVVREAHGSPLLAEQLVSALGDRSAAGAVSDPMAARIRRLDPDTLRLVQLAALGEGHLEHRLLARTHGAPEAVFDAAVDRALQVGLLGYRSGEREFTFAHPLLRQAADGTLAPGDRLRGHRRWGEVLSLATADLADPRLLVAAANHWAATDDDRATFTASLAAARETHRLGAATATADLLLRAWELWDRLPDAPALADRPRDELYLDLGDALRAADRLAEMRPVIDRETTRRSSGAGSGGVSGLCRRMYAAERWELLGQPEQESLYAEALAHATELLAAPSDRFLVTTLNQLGAHVRWTDPELADRCLDRALAASRETRDPTCISVTASKVAARRSARGRHEEALAMCTAALADCRSVGDYLDTETLCGDVLARSGQLRSGVAQLDRALDRLPDPALAPQEWVSTAVVAAEWRIALGDWDQAAELLETCQRSGSTTGRSGPGWPPPRPGSPACAGTWRRPVGGPSGPTRGWGPRLLRRGTWSAKP